MSEKDAGFVLQGGQRLLQFGHQPAVLARRRFVRPVFTPGILHGEQLDVRAQQAAPGAEGAGAATGMRKANQSQFALACGGQRFQASLGSPEGYVVHGRLIAVQDEGEGDRAIPGFSAKAIS
ncbi:hypothetical protein D3C78_1169850 [compost metagenome]